jgi:hypothetical protein
MSYNYKNPSNRMKAAQLLKKLLPLAEQEAREQRAPLQAATAIGHATLRHYHISKCAGVHVYKGEKGGWFADLEFRGLPLGAGNIIGTPSQLPAKDREEAIGQAISMIASCMNAPAPAEPADAVDSAFAFDEIEMAVPGELLRTIKAAFEELPTPQQAVALLEKVRSDFAAGGPLTGDVMRGLSKEDLRRVQFACAIALMAGLPRYPQYEEAPPPPPRSSMN